MIISHCRDLGVIITSDLSCSLHIQQICVKAHQRANSILRCSVSGNVKLLLRALIYCICQTVGYIIQLHGHLIWSATLNG